MQVEKITAKRFLVRSLFDGERICHLQLVDLTGHYLSVTPFDRETPSTVFVDARVILLDRRQLSSDILNEPGITIGQFSHPSMKPLVAVPGLTPASCVEAMVCQI